MMKQKKKLQLFLSKDSLNIGALWYGGINNLPLPVSSSEFSENAHRFFRKFVSRTIFNKNGNGSGFK